MTMGMAETMSTRGMMMAMEVAMVEMATTTKSETPPPLMIPMNMMMMTTTTMMIIITTTQMLHPRTTLHCRTKCLNPTITTQMRQTLTTLRCRTMCLKTLTRSTNLTIKLQSIKLTRNTAAKKRGGKGKAQKKPVSRKRKSATLPMGHSGDRTIKLIVSEHNVSECIVKKALIATNTPFEEVQYDKFKTC